MRRRYCLNTRNALTFTCLRRARLACVSWGFRRFCARHAAHVSRNTELIVPRAGTDSYVTAVSRWLFVHSAGLRTVRLRFEVRCSCMRVQFCCCTTPCLVCLHAPLTDNNCREDDLLRRASWNAIFAVYATLPHLFLRRWL